MFIVYIILFTGNKHLVHGLTTSPSTFLNWLCGSKADASLFKTNSFHVLFLLIYLDNIIFIGSSSMELIISSCFLLILCLERSQFFAFFFFGIEASRSNDGLHSSQHKYIHNFLVFTNMQEAKRMPTSMSSSPS